MWPSRAVRLLLAALLCLWAAGVAAGQDTWILWSGSVRKGEVPVRREAGQTLAAADVMVSSLGLAPRGRNDALVVAFEGKKLEFWVDSPVARLNGALVPLPSPPVQEGDRWWVDAAAALRLFNQFLVSAGRPGDLQWKGVGELPSPAPERAVSPPPSRGATSPSPASASRGTKNVLKGLRWGDQRDALRAVLDLETSEGVEVRNLPGRVEVILPGAVPGGVLLTSPQEDRVKVQATVYGDRTVLAFPHRTSGVRAVTLQKPPRLVLDFRGTGGGGAALSPVPTAASEGERPSAPTAAPEPTGGTERVERVFKGKRPVVALDPGHGGKDPGAMANGLREKDVNLKVGLLLRSILEQYGVDARLTRGDDRYLKLGERTQLANNWNADLFVSLHCNALPAGRHSKGVELYLMALPSDKDAMRLALFENKELGEGGKEGQAASDRRTKLLLQILGDMQQNEKISESTSVAEVLFAAGKQGGLPMKRVAQAPFFVLRGAAMPALLVEMGFLTERDEAALLNQPGYQERIASSLARGIVNYLKR